MYDSGVAAMYWHQLKLVRQCCAARSIAAVCRKSGSTGSCMESGADACRSFVALAGRSADDVEVPLWYCACYCSGATSAAFSNAGRCIVLLPCARAAMYLSCNARRSCWQAAANGR